MTDRVGYQKLNLLEKPRQRCQLTNYRINFLKLKKSSEASLVSDSVSVPCNKPYNLVPNWFEFDNPLVYDFNSKNHVLPELCKSEYEKFELINIKYILNNIRQKLNYECQALPEQSVQCKPKK